jgi:hypothetical protein
LCPAAFSNAVLADERWLLGAVSKDVAGSHLWTNVLRVTPTKQEIFIKRILFLHALGVRRGNKASTIRLTVSDFYSECQRMMMLAYVFECMEVASDPEGKQLFGEDVLVKIKKNMLEGIPG